MTLKRKLDRYMLVRDIGLIGCFTDDELFNGSTIRRARLPRHTPTLLEAYGLGTESTADQYCEAIRRWMLGRDHPDFISEEQMFAIMGSKHVRRF